MENWILGQPVQTDNTDFEWILGVLYVLYEITAGGPTNLKSVNGVLKADIMSINGVAIGDIKSVNGIE